MYCKNWGPNMKWGAQISNGAPGTTAPPLATALIYEHLQWIEFQQLTFLQLNKVNHRIEVTCASMEKITEFLLSKK